MMIQHALSYASAELTLSESPDVDSQVILCYVLSCQTSYLHTWPDKMLSDDQRIQFVRLIEQRKQGRPVAHLIGQRGFWSLNLIVTENTLIPRPDTELLVTLALTKITEAMVVADLGTGTGAIALSLAVEQPNITVLAMDYSNASLQVARVNAKNNQIDNVSFWQGDWLTALGPDCVDMIVSNPPYIEHNDPHLTQGDVAFEPRQALVSGADGLVDIRQIINQAQDCLKPSGWLLLEHGYQQASEVRTLLQQSSFDHISSHQDYGGNDRVTIGQLTL